MARNEQCRPDRGGVAVVLLTGERPQDTPTATLGEAAETQAARWLQHRYRLDFHRALLIVALAGLVDELNVWKGEGRPGRGWDGWTYEPVPLGAALALPVEGEGVNAPLPNYIPPDRIHIHGVWKTALLVRRWRHGCAELARGPEGVGLDELRRLHAQHRLRFIDGSWCVEVLVTEPDAPGRF